MATKPAPTSVDDSITRQLTPEMRETFLAHVADGLNRSEAARKVGSTGTRFRKLCHRDEEFRARFEQALLDGHQGIEDRVRDAIWRRALAGKTQGSDRLLLVLGDSHLPEFEWRRSRRVEMTGKDGGPLEVAHLDAIDVEIRRLLGVMAAGDAAGAAVEAPVDPVGAAGEAG